MMNRLVLMIILGMAWTFTAQADIGILEINPSDKGACDGSIMVRADGSAGPFTIEVTGPSGNISLTNIQGDALLNNLCTGTYTIQIYPAKYPSCGTSLDATIPLKEGKEEKMDGQIDAKNFPVEISAPLTLKAFPNPFSERLELIIFSEQSQKVKLRLIDVKGQLIYQTERSVLVGNNQINLNLENISLVDGIYELVMEDENNNLRSLKLTYAR